MNIRSTQVSLRKFLMGFLLMLAAPLRAMTTKKPTPRHMKVKWIKLEEERVGPGDFWFNHKTDPNTPELQNSENSHYNLLGQAVHASHYGTKAKDIGRGNGDYWRPVGLVPVE